MNERMRMPNMIKKSGMRLIAAFIATICVLPADYRASADVDVRPVLYVEAYRVEGMLSAGEDIIIHFKLRNASSQSPVSNILFTVQSPGWALYPSPEASNQYFIPRIGPEETESLAVYLTVRGSVPSDAYEINYSISYQGEETDTVLSNSGTISVSVISGSLEIASVDVPDTCYVGRLVYISVRYINTSDSEMYGARVQINGLIEESQKIIEIGTVRASSGGIAERNVTFLASGDQMITFDLIYEDGNGNEITADTSSSHVTVDELASPNKSEEPQAQVADRQSRSIPGTLFGIISDYAVLIIGAAAIICSAVIIITWLRKRRS